MTSSLKKDKSKIRFFNQYLYVISDRKNIRGEICHAIYLYTKANNKQLKNYHKYKLYLKYCGVYNLYRRKMSQKLLGASFKWVENTFKLNKNFNNNEAHFLKFHVQYPEKLHEIPNDLQF